MKIIKYILLGLTITAIAVLLTCSIIQGKRIRTLKSVTAHQQVVIDSLLNRRTTFIDCRLMVTDKSRNIIYGRYNKGSISQPQERKYILEIDSTNIKIR